MQDPNDEWKPSADDAYDPAVDDAIAKHKVEAPEAYNDLAPSRRARSAPPLSQSVLNEVRKKGGGGAGFTSGGTPINPEQLKNEAQTRAFFAGKKNQSIDPYSDASQYGMSRVAPKSAEALLNTRGSQTENQARKGMLDDIYSKYGDKSIAPKVSSALGMYDTQNDTEEDKRINQSGEGISHTTQRWTEKLKGIPEYDNGDFGRAYKQEVDNFIAQNPAYKDQLNKVGYAGFQVKEIDPYQVMEQVMTGNQSPTKPTTNSLGKTIKTDNRAKDQPPINLKDRNTWTQGRDVLTAEKTRTRDQRLAKPSMYFSENEGRWVSTNQFDQPKHTDMLAQLAFKNQDLGQRDNFLSDLKNSINAELISQQNELNEGTWDLQSSYEKKPSKEVQVAINSMAEDMLEMQYYKDILKKGQSGTLQRTPEQIQNHLINLKNRYNATKRNATSLPSGKMFD